MRAIVVQKFGGPEVLQLDSDYPKPTLADNKVLLRVRCIGVNPVETYIRAGTYARLPQLPYIPGNDGAGTVEAVGSGVTAFKPGDRVFWTRPDNSGSYAEYCTSNESSIWSLPDSLTFEQGAALGVPYFTAYRALFAKCKAKPGDRVLIHGASGAVGLAAVQLAAARGVHVYGTAGTTEGMKLVQNSGAIEVFNHRSPDYVQQVQASNPGGFNGIVEMLANVNLAQDLEWLAPTGIACVVGCRGSIEINPRLMMGKESSVVGCALNSANEADWKEMGAAITAGIAKGHLKPIVSKVFPLADAASAHKEVIESTGAMGKVVLAVD
uniref:Enoyl reductase (ER) domain-containing protein n=1 Tax=Plectus sambesii TaxID=2011161 RepID=A0A914WT24_9BILA